MPSLNSINSVLISVFDKTDILYFARSLHERGVKIFSTDGTANILSKAKLPIIKLETYTGLPNIIDGRLKTLNHKIHGGILGRHKIDNDVMKKYGIEYINMVVVNFYPFDKIIKNKNHTCKEAIENIDIGGPAMVRSAAKNYDYVSIVINNKDYSMIIKEMDSHNNSITLKTNFHLAVKAFEYVAIYDRVIANYFNNRFQNSLTTNNTLSNLFPQTINLNFKKQQNMRYGENSHQLSALYTNINNNQDISILNTKQLQGKSLSYNNIIDADVALECVNNFIEPTCVIVKHTNLCGVATSKNILEAYNNAYFADHISAFGGIIAFNKILDIKTVKTIIDRQFVEIIIAPYISDDALSILSCKKNIRVLIYNNDQKKIPKLDYRIIKGGLLIQEYDSIVLNENNIRIMTKRFPTITNLKDAIFSWKIVKFVKSNAIVFACNQKTIGIGSGQTSRIDSVKIALIKAKNAGFTIQSSVMASDAFISFSDVIITSATAGIDCIIQPGGSIHDKELINIANKHNITMLFTGIRHFRH